MNLKVRGKLRIWAVLLTGFLVALVALPLAAAAHPAQRPLADAPWSRDARVNDDATTEDQWFPSIAVDPTGNAYAVWHDFRNLNWDIYFSYRPNGGSWGPNVRVDDDGTGADQSFPSLAVDPSGNAYAVWRDERNGDWDIYYSYRPAGGAWGPNVRVDDDGTGADQVFPSLAVDPSGNAYAVWRDERNGDWDIYFSHRPAGGLWGANVRVDDDGTGADQDNPKIAVDPNGNSHAVWQDERNEISPDIYSSYRPAGGGWGANARVDDSVASTRQSHPDIAVDPGGNAYAVWQDERSGTDFDIYSSYRRAGGSWGANVRVDDDGTGAEQTGPSIAVDPCGNAYAVWWDNRADSTWDDIFFSYGPAGGNWAPDVRVDDGVADTTQWEPDIAVDPCGNAYAAWNDTRNGPGQADVYFAYLPAPVSCCEEEFVPEPGTAILLASGLMGMAGYAGLRLRKK
jgi:hypothetical protein